jgi:UDPglucose 6-dehydrogenase
MRTMQEVIVAVAGTGYVGLSLSCLFGQTHKVYAVDIVREKVDMINKRFEYRGNPAF